MASAWTKRYRFLLSWFLLGGESAGHLTFYFILCQAFLRPWREREALSNEKLNTVHTARPRNFLEMLIQHRPAALPPGGWGGCDGHGECAAFLSLWQGGWEPLGQGQAGGQGGAVPHPSHCLSISLVWIEIFSSVPHRSLLHTIN
jgi:hypothetical protein